MAHHKKRRPKNRRAGCLMCKPHKANGVKKRCRKGTSGALMDGLRRSWKQEYRGHLKMLEGIAETRDLD